MLHSTTTLAIVLFSCFCVCLVVAHEKTTICVHGEDVEVEVFNKTLQNLRIAAVNRLYSNLIFPKAAEIIQSGGAAQDVFDWNATGRINAIGIFVGLQDTVEYFYALAGPVDGVRVNGTSYVYKVDIRVLDVVGTRASVQANIWFTAYNTDTIYYITQAGWLVFTPNSAKVSMYDLTLLRLDQEADLGPALNPILITALCTQTQSVCVGANKQFDNETACESFMSSIPFGSWSNAFSYTVVCRILHGALTLVRPAYHCPHVGPTGGGKCIFHSYNSWLDNEFVANPIPDSHLPTPCVTFP